MYLQQRRLTCARYTGSETNPSSQSIIELREFEARTGKQVLIALQAPTVTLTRNHKTSSSLFNPNFIFQVAI